MSPLASRPTAWLHLALALYLAMAPASGLVVCIEPDGAVGIEFATADNRCCGCSETPSESERPGGSPGLSDHRDCPCVDVPVVSGCDEARTNPKPIELDARLFVIAPSLVTSLLDQLEPRPIRENRHPPRRVLSFPHLRSVVLLV